MLCDDVKTSGPWNCGWARVGLTAAWLAIGLLVPCQPVRGEAGTSVEQLKKELENIEARHRRELQQLEKQYREKLDAVKQQQERQLSEVMKRLQALEKGKAVPGKPSEEPQGMREKVDRLEDELSFLKLQREQEQEGLLQKVELHIYGTAEFENFTATNSALDARNVAFVASAALTDRLSTRIIFEFEPNPGDTRGVETDLDQGWLEYRINEAFRPRFGVVLVPFGQFNPNHFDILNDLSSRPILMTKIIPVSWSEVGAGFAGDIIVGDLDALEDTWFSETAIEYEFYAINGFTNDLSDTSVRAGTGDLDVDPNNNKAFVGRFGFQLPYGQKLGISGYSGKYDRNHEIYGLDVDWNFSRGPFELLGEYALFNLDSGGVERNGDRVPGYYQGGYIQANYHFWPAFLNDSFLGRRFESPKFTGIVRYGQVKIGDDGDPGQGNNSESRWSIGLNYRPVETWAFKIEYQFNHADNETVDRGDSDGFVFSVTATF